MTEERNISLGLTELWICERLPVSLILYFFEKECFSRSDVIKSIGKSILHRIVTNAYHECQHGGPERRLRNGICEMVIVKRRLRNSVCEMLSVKRKGTQKSDADRGGTEERDRL